jgi:DNA-binding response OmpR family regulator
MSADPSGRLVDYYFGPYRFDGRLRCLYKDDELVVLTTKAADTLVALLKRSARVVEKDEVLRAVWGTEVKGVVRARSPNCCYDSDQTVQSLQE